MLGADALSSETMGRFAFRMRLSETSYVQSSDHPGADYRHRIFTMTRELPFAGHPSIGTATAVALASGLRHAELTQSTGAGLQRLHVDISEDGRRASVDLEQNPPQFLDSPDPSSALAVLGLSDDEAGEDGEGGGVQVVSTGLPTLIVPVRDVATLGRATPDIAELGRLLSGLATPPTTLYAVVHESAGRWRARSFTAAVAGGEDPATGSAVGPLAAYARRRYGEQRIEVLQGIEMGCPSQLAASCDGDRVVVSGAVQVLGSGEVLLPVPGT